MNYKKSYGRLHIGMLLAVLLMLCAVSFGVWILAVCGAAVGLGGILQARRYYKCPRCGKSLPLWKIMPEYCPDCQTGLRQEAQ